MATETTKTWGCCDDARVVVVVVVVVVVATGWWARIRAVDGGLLRLRARSSSGDSGDEGVDAIERTTVYTV